MKELTTGTHMMASIASHEATLRVLKVRMVKTFGCQVKVAAVDGKYCMHGEDDNAYKILVGILKEKGQLGDIRID
jgi:hypothetical protein